MGKRKFKVGDEVIFLDGSNLEHRNCMAPNMKQYVGKSGVIIGVATCHENWCSYTVKGGGGYWWPDNFLMMKPQEKIVIYREDDKTVVALDKSTGKEAVAKCNPQDTFDFHAGAKIAFDRLISEGVEAKKEDSAIKVGDLVRISNPGKMYTTNYIWVRDNVTDKTLIAKYAYGRSFYRNPNGEEAGPFKVLIIRDGRAYIQKTSLIDSACFLVDIDGLEKYK